jgi:hypothetical protein
MNHRTLFGLKETLLELARKDLPDDGANEDVEEGKGKFNHWGRTERPT